MAVYVDGMKAQLGHMFMCHMLSDSDEELDVMAARIGVSRMWHQAPPEVSPSYSQQVRDSLAGMVQTSGIA